ncbi:MAG TPA: arsenite efflux transporter metallochaperone ArsD [Kofleriaceae bacterium]|nr:arsenite efflux transporter metallochaperone ArsD [Kofleriaceae bacterium]
MISLQVFDPAMCCSTGICGPSVDPQLVRFSADLEWLKQRGVEVSRYNLSQQPAAFAQDASVKAALESKGEAALPLLKINGEVKTTGTYPTRAELAAWAGLDMESSASKTNAGCCSPKVAPAAGGACCSPEEMAASKPGCC